MAEEGDTYLSLALLAVKLHTSPDWANPEPRLILSPIPTPESVYTEATFPLKAPEGYELGEFRELTEKDAGKMYLAAPSGGWALTIGVCMHGLAGDYYYTRKLKSKPTFPMTIYCIVSSFCFIGLSFIWKTDHILNVLLKLAVLGLGVWGLAAALLPR